MKWFRIPKEDAIIPTKGTYKDWKPQLSEEGNHQCVYCCIGENPFGGIRNFHVEHYKPKSKDEFKHLENEYENLFFACSICNCFKSDDWPNDPNDNLDNTCYPNPAVIDYNEIIDIKDDFILNGNTVASNYIINKLFLNRPQLILERKEHKLSLFIDDLIKEQRILFKKLLNKNCDESKVYLEKLNELICNILDLRNKQKQVIPYKASQIKRNE